MKVSDGCVEIYDCRNQQRKISDYVPQPIPFTLREMGRKMLNYARGYKYCGRCQTTYLTDLLYCPVCSSLLRTKSRKRQAVKMIDPERYGVRVEA